MNADTLTPSPFWRRLGLISGLALLVRLATLAFRLGGNANLNEVPYWFYGNSDIPGWLALARHFAGGGDLSYWLLGARPPLFPLSVALVYRLGGGDLAALLLQTLFGTLTVSIGFALAWTLFRRAGIERGERWAALAGAVMACDPASVWISTSLLSEPLFNLLFTAFLFNLARYISGEGLADLALSALWMGLAMLTRPTAIYLWLASPLILAPLVKGWWRPVLALAMVGLGVYLGWAYRNYQVQGVFTYSTHTNFTLLFYRALSAEHLSTGVEATDLQAAYIREVYQAVGDPRAEGVIDPGQMWDFQVAETPEIYAAQGDLAFQKLRRYWLEAVLGTGVGAWRMFMVTRAFQIPGWFTLIEVIYHTALYGTCLYGGWRAYKTKRWELLLLCALPILYVSGITFAAQTSGMDTRMRSPISVPIIILAAHGWSWGLGSQSDER